MISSLFRQLTRKQIKEYILVVAKSYPDWHSKAGHFTHYGSKILKRTEVQKIHEISLDCDYWMEVASHVKRKKAEILVCYRKIDGRYVEDTKICTLKKVNIQKGHFMPAIEDGLRIGNKVIPISVIAANHGLSESDFIEWYKYQADNQIIIIHFTDFKY